MNKKISIDPITRLEGHGRIDLFLNDEGSLENAYMIIPELRGFEKFSEGRPVEEMPQITQRICGVCPTAHHLAAAKAGDAVYHVDPPKAAKMIRELLNCAFFAGDHGTHFYVLGGPDFIVGPSAPKAERNILGVVRKVGKEIGSKAIQLLADNHEICSIIGGRFIHPVAAIVGGVTKPLTKEDQAKILELSKRSLETAKFTLKLFDDLVLKNKEYLDLILAVRVVPSVQAAIDHINHYGSHHSDAIITAASRTAGKFTRAVDSATVYVNASTRFTDGGEFGMGAEIGISTQKFHARGPMALREITSYKWCIRGSGQVRP